MKRESNPTHSWIQAHEHKKPTTATQCQSQTGFIGQPG